MTMKVGAYTASGWSIDTRTLAPGDFFFALRGPNHDGHDYVANAFERGAVAAMVDRAMPGPTVVVDDTQKGLERLGAEARRSWGGTVIGITGSAGKTSTKDVVAACLNAALPAAKTEGNLNNHIGVPLTLLRVPESAKVAVLEMGMNHAGEIRHLCAIASPEIGVVTNVGYAHVENFESIDGIAAAKRELIESLPRDGVAVLNADDARVAAFSKAHAGRTLTYGVRESADVRAEHLTLGADGSHFCVHGEEISLAIPGRHAVSNALAGIAVASLFGIPMRRLLPVLEAWRPGKMRGERLMHGGVLVFNDCYNSNPDAARAMLDVLRDSPARHRIAVLGEMLELGRWAEPLHRDVGNYAVAQGVSVLIGIRGAARHTVEAARQAGLPEGAALFFEDPKDAGDAVRALAQRGDAVLFKGSRGTRVELALERFLASDDGGAAAA
jgi:UDP-N-acetylmuramoyl-tripeptide--D-alanyl-D-alanine ligase